MAQFEVMRDHDVYRRGDTRTAEKSDVAHLVEIGVLRPAKASRPVKNKTAADPANKSA